MSGYVSVEKNMRGFIYKREWARDIGFWRAMKFNIEKENDEIEWALLIDDMGVVQAKYRRGTIIPKV